MEAKDRKDMNPEYTWDLTPVFADEAAWQTAFIQA